MSRLLRFEFDKLLRRKSFYIITAIAAGFVVLGAVSVNLLISMKDSIENFDVSNLMNYSGWRFASEAISTSNFTILSGIFIALLVCSENDDGTIKNIYARGYGRTPVYIGTYISSLCGAVIMYFVSVMAGFIIGTVFWGTGDIGNSLTSIATQVVVVLAYHALFFMLSAVIGRNGFAIAATIVIPMVVSLLLSLIDNFAKAVSFNTSDYWIESILTKAINGSDTATCIVASVIYAAVFFAVGLVINRKKQV